MADQASYKEWFTASELAGLSDLPSTDRRIRERAKREGWKARKRSFGKGFEYHIDSLPYRAAAELRARMLDAAADAGRDIVVPVQDAAAQADVALDKLDEIKAYQELPTDKRLRVEAKLWALEEAAKYRKRHALGKIAGMALFCDEYNAGICVPPKHLVDYLPRHNGQRHLAVSGLRRWERLLRQNGRAALVDHYGLRKDNGKIDTTPELKRVILGCLTQQPHITSRKIKAYLEAQHPELDIVSARSIARWVARWRQQNEWVWNYLTCPDGWKSHMMPAFGSQHESVERLNQMWELDSTPGDWMLTDGRHSVIGVIDLYSRRVKLHVSKSSTAAAVTQVFRRAVLDWGVPESIRTDNGKDYVSDHFTSVTKALGVTQYLCVPFASEEKATVERFFRTMSHGVLDLLDGFIGHNVAEQQQIRARKSFSDRLMDPDSVVEVKLSSDELQQKLDDWVEHVYHQNPHSGLDGRTPWSVAQAWTQPVRRIEDERALDCLLQPVAGIRRVNKKGILLDHHYYISADLAIYIGRDVRLRRDEADIGRLYVYDLDGQFLCMAECPKLLGYSAAEIASAAKRKALQFARAQRQELMSYKRAIKRNIAEVILEHRIEQSEKLAALPQRSVPYSTPALEQAGIAARAGRGTAASADDQRLQLSEHERELQKQLEEQLTSGPAEVHEIHDTPEQRYARAWTLEQREQLSDEDRQWLEGYQKSVEYSSQKRFHEAFSLTPKWRQAEQ